MDEKLRLDGNAAAGSLREIFSFEVTTAQYACEGCGRTDRAAMAVLPGGLYALAVGVALIVLALRVRGLRRGEDCRVT
jgi:hypothetical protein